MVSIPVYNREGQQVDTYEIDPAELAPRINKQLLHDAVVMYRANLRLGTAKAKSRSEVAGSTRKLYRQKGTGRARAGMRRTPIRRGGGRAHPKRPQDWSYRLPKKALRLATRMALASRIADNEVILIDELKFEAPKTREAAGILNKLGLAGMRLLVTLDNYDPIAYKSLRNIDKVETLPVSDINAYEVLRPKRILMTRAALDMFRAKVVAGTA
ncbi:MAG: 50S ribosomal protein L4 [Thermogutta sp.]|nr:50S ribosomal protein L4 [Thermogutta sp.]HPU06595.1 50S ribosomal protein L4 [Thermogutta sp.]HQF12741.1 50S ribosomal protein L4 [Thermogutta sp.]